MSVDLPCKLLRSVKAHLLLTVIQSSDFDNDGQVTSRFDRYGNGGHVYIQNGGILVIQSNPIIVDAILPLLDVDNHVNSGGFLNC